MRRLLGVRIVRWQFKLLYIFAVWWAAGFLLARALDAIGLPHVVVIAAGSMFDLGVYLYAARVFRVSGEAVQPPRAWWRMTGRRRLSVVLGVAFTVFAATEFVQQTRFALGFGFGTHPPTRLEVADVPSGFVLGAESCVLAFLYLNSAVRLRANVAPPKPAKLAKPIDLRSPRTRSPLE